MKIAIIGLGLIGGSLGKALVCKNHEVYGYDIDGGVISRALSVRAITAPLDEKSLGECDIAVLAVTPNAVVELLPELAKRLKSGAILTDIAGVKREIVAEMESLAKEYPNIDFISTHPMAGREVSGIENSIETLFEGCFAVLIKVGCGERAASTVCGLYSEIGAAGVQFSTAERHDEMIAYTSQLAHVVSSGYVKNPLSKRHAGYSAGSFADMVRVARISSATWAELCVKNADNLVRQIDDLAENLAQFREALARGDQSELKRLFDEANAAKTAADESFKERRNEG